VSDRIHAVEADFNEWIPLREYDAVMANQSLHHVLRLENLLDQVKSCLKQGGLFIVSDMIGRNGHQRWPRALRLVRQFWRRLPPSYRFNQKLQRYEEMFEDWDCSKEGFEGVRSEEILPLLVERFQFHFFFAFANVIEPFVDRHFGHHFNANAEWDRAFIDEVARCDEEAIRAGRIKPTHMMSVLSNEPGILIYEPPLTPAYCLQGEADPDMDGDGELVYEWGCWPHDARVELETACGMLRGAEHRTMALRRELEESDDLIRRFAAEVDRVNQTLEETVVWAQGLDREVGELQRLVEERTAWAQAVDRERVELTARALRLSEELQESQRRCQELEQSQPWWRKFRSRFRREN
jgi:hypothetical protein